MRCRHRSSFRQCGSEAVREGLCSKHAHDCGKGGCSHATDRTYCDTHECISDKCIRQRFGRGDSCGKHGCAIPMVFDGMTLACGNSHKARSKYCTEHACAECEKFRGAMGEYCNVHGCKRKLGVNYCGARRKRNSYMCENHACADSDCGNESLRGGKYCNDHTCADAGCGNACIGGSKFCTKHCCHNEGCLSAGGADGPYCQNHGCVTRVQGGLCGMLPKLGSTFCADHACSECDRPRDGDGECCGEHGCVHESGVMACRAAKRQGSDYCADHSCAVEGCFDKSAGAECCSRHSCEYSGEGSGPCGIQKKRGSDYCADHSCTYPWCGSVREVGELCRKHVCEHISDDIACEVVKKDGSKYCRNHACAENTCGNIASGGGGMCATHGCQSYVMGPGSAICGAVREEKSKWCALHECRRTRCKKTNDGQGDCCHKHGCKYESPDVGNRLCMAPRKGRSDYCESHICAVCDNYTYTWDNGYCDLHTCTYVDDWQRCINRATTPTNTCRMHSEKTGHTPLDRATPKPLDVTPRPVLPYDTREDPFAEMNKLLQDKDLAGVEIIDNPSLSWDDVIGADEAKKAIRQSIIQPYLRPEFYAGGWSNGILLFGPPGTGKTLLITATANQISGVLLNVETADIMSRWVGKSEHRIKALFKIANQYSEKHRKPVILFMDEVDALLGQSDYTQSWEVTMRNQFLVGMSGTMTTGKKSLVYVIGATNQPQNIALGFRRRFQKRILVDLPEKDARKRLFELHSKKLEIASGVDFDALAARSDGYSGSDIEQVCKDANSITVDEAFASDSDEKHTNRLRAITMDDFSKSLKERKSTVSAELAQKYREYI